MGSNNVARTSLAIAVISIIAVPNVLAGTHAESKSIVDNYNPSQIIYPGDAQDVAISSPGSTSEAQTSVQTYAYPGILLANGYAFADHGILKVAAVSSSEAGGVASSRNLASFADTITLSSAGWAGQIGTYSASLDFDWRVLGGYQSVSARSDLEALLTVKLTNESGQVSQWTRRELIQYNYNGSGTNQVTFQAFDKGVAVPFTSTIAIENSFRFGSSFTLEVQLQANVASSWNASAALDAAHSAYWGGIGSVNAAGLPVPFVATSVSGTDWAQSFVPSPVPEPASWALWFAGLAVVFNWAGAGRRADASR